MQILTKADERTRVRDWVYDYFDHRVGLGNAYISRVYDVGNQSKRRYKRRMDRQTAHQLNHDDRLGA